MSLVSLIIAQRQTPQEEIWPGGNASGLREERPVLRRVRQRHFEWDAPPPSAPEVVWPREFYLAELVPCPPP